MTMISEVTQAWALRPVEHINGAECRNGQGWKGTDADMNMACWRSNRYLDLRISDEWDST